MCITFDPHWHRDKSDKSWLPVLRLSTSLTAIVLSMEYIDLRVSATKFGFILELSDEFPLMMFILWGFEVQE